jgi:hypothetical protein
VEKPSPNYWKDEAGSKSSQLVDMKFLFGRVRDGRIFGVIMRACALSVVFLMRRGCALTVCNILTLLFFANDLGI